MKLSLAASALVVGLVLHGAAGAQAARANAANGQELFLRLGCPACHGTVGQGGAGRRLAPSTLPLEAFRTWIRTGSPAWSFASGMPAYPEATFSDAEIADVQAYLASLPAPRSPDEIPLLKP